MHLSLEALQNHLAYTRWATEQLLHAASELTPEELARDFGTADKSVLGTLTHVFRAEKVWLARVEEKTPPPFKEPGEEDLAFLVENWPRLHQNWRAWADNTKAEDLGGTLVYHDLRGNERRDVLWHIVLHVVNHSTHHRGQVSGFLRAVGRTPPSLDLIQFVRIR